jgi:hypothetical protein
MICWAFLHLYADPDQLFGSQAQYGNITLSLSNNHCELQDHADYCMVAFQNI